MGCWEENMFKFSRSHDQDGFLSHIWNKPSKISFFGTKRPMTLEVGKHHRILKYYQICFNDDTRLTLTIFITWPKVFPNTSALVKAYTVYSHDFASLFSISYALR